MNASVLIEQDFVYGEPKVESTWGQVINDLKCCYKLQRIKLFLAMDKRDNTVNGGDTTTKVVGWRTVL